MCSSCCFVASAQGSGCSLVAVRLSGPLPSWGGCCRQRVPWQLWLCFLPKIPPIWSDLEYFRHAVKFCPELPHIKKGLVLPVRAAQPSCGAVGLEELPWARTLRAEAGCCSSPGVAVRGRRAGAGHFWRAAGECVTELLPSHRPSSQQRPPCREPSAIISWWQSAAACCCHRDSDWLERQNAQSYGACALMTAFSRCQSQLTFRPGFQTDLRLYFCNSGLDWSLFPPSKF